LRKKRQKRSKPKSSLNDMYGEDEPESHIEQLDVPVQTKPKDVKNKMATTMEMAEQMMAQRDRFQSEMDPHHGRKIE
jgi:hypothetical protein